MAFIDITDCVSRMERAEASLGICMSGVMATADRDCDDNGEYKVQVTGEVLSLNESGFVHDVCIRIAVYNGAGQVVGSGDILVVQDSGSPLEIFDQVLYCRGKPASIRFIPKMA